jgi:hypothetical protein
MKRIASVILLTMLTTTGHASISTNVPLNHWSYQFIDKLVNQNLIDTAMLTTKPISRLEMARLIQEAQKRTMDNPDIPSVTCALIERLSREFRYELDRLNSPGYQFSDTFIKPLEDPYYRYLIVSKIQDLENQAGDRFVKGNNTRLGFITRGVIWNTLAFYVHPEYESPSPTTDRGIKSIEAYGKLAVGDMEIEVGKDALWWGPGYHGFMIMSNNAENLTMVKLSNPVPVLLPGILSGFGPFKAVYFLAELEENRDVPCPKLTGIRVNFKPHPNWEIGLSRTIMFGGQGNKTDTKDYLQIVWPKNIQNNENQLATIDTKVRLPLPKPVPLSSAEFYLDFTGEDAAGFSKYRPLLGMQLNDILKTGRTDLRIEYAKTNIGEFPDVFYNHTFFTSGYTYKGRVIGHHMGTNARDVFIRLSHFINANMILGIEYDKQIHQPNTISRSITEQVGADLLWFTPFQWQLKAGYRYENKKNALNANYENHLMDLSAVYNY